MRIRTFLSSLLLIVALAFFTTEALAKKPLNTPGKGADGGSDGGTSTNCLSNKELNVLAKSYLTELQAIDPNVTLTDVKNVLTANGDCVTSQSATDAIGDYSVQLLAATTADPQNSPPTISGSPISSVMEGGTYLFTPAANDADGDSLSFTVTNKPHWASFDTASGTMRGTPGYADAGSYSNILISVSDGTDSAALPAFSIQVSNVNRSPSITGTPATSVAEGGSYSFKPSVADPDGDSLSFSVANLPPWATFNPTSGALSGSPDYADAGTYSNILISVSDGADSAALPAFSIVVTNVNRSPSISGIPALNITEGDTYYFAPTSSDPDGDKLSFAAANLPPWAIFDPATGTISGIPTSNDVGLYEDISITVTDGLASAYLSGISISVNGTGMASGTAVLQWGIPTTRTDGTPLALSEIDGYRIYMGTTNDSLELFVDLNDATSTSYSVTDLPTGTYYFSITTYDLNGSESGFSNIAAKSI